MAHDDEQSPRIDESTGDGPPQDGSASDGSALDSATPDELRRWAFGRTENPVEDARARWAAERLTALDARSRAEAEAAAQALVPDPPTSDATFDTDAPFETDADGVGPRLHYPRWLLPFAAIALVGVGVLGGIAAAEAGATSEVPGNTPTGSETAEPTLTFDDVVVQLPNEEAPSRGDLDAAERWLAVPQTPDDVLAGKNNNQALKYFAPDSTRLVQQNRGGQPWNVWVGKERDGDLCLILADPELTEMSWSCANRENFVTYGLTFSINDRDVRWDGRQVITTRVRE